MIHSFLIVGGTKDKRRFRATQKTQWIGESDNQNVRESDLSDTLTHRRSDAPSCSEFSEFDTTILEPEEDKQTIGIDQVRDLQHQLSLRPYAAKCKTGVILEAQRLTVEAQNALLKTLEEPPAHSVLVLTAPGTRVLLPTLVSRCQIVRLRAEIDLDLESEEHQQQAKEFLQLLQQGRPARQRVAAGESGRGERLAWVEENKKILSSQSASGGSTINNLDVWLSVLRDLLLINSGCPSLTLNSPTIKQFNNLTINNSDLVKSLALTIKTKRLISSTNVSPRLALEVLLLDLPTL